MQKINYQLIVSDFDGTLAQTDKGISEKNKAAIARYIENGGKFAVSTGRAPAGILPRVKELGLSGAVCCSQGCVIVDIESEEILFEKRLSNDVAVAVCKKMEELGLHIHVYELDEYYSNMNDDFLIYYQKAVNMNAIIIDNMPISQFVQEKKMQPIKVLAMVDPDDIERIRLELEKENFKDCDITRSASVIIDVGHSDCTKGTSIEFLAKLYGVDMQKTIAIGDQCNDLSMIKTAGLGFAVKNADAQLKKHAICLDLSNDEDAVAHVIERYGYTEE